MNALFRLFIKNADDTTDPAVRNAYGNFTGLFGIVSNVLLFLVKFILGLITSSISITADAINNLCDAGSSVITVFGFKIAGKPADKKHPYGHARMEYISGLIVSCLVTAIGFDLCISSIEKIINPTETKHTAVTISILGITVIAKLFQGFVYRSAGKKINSPALIASSADSLNDVISTIVVVIGGIIGMTTNIKLDGWLGLAVALFVIYSGIKLIIETSDPLLGAAPDEALVEALSQKILSYEGVIGLHDLVVHNYGFGRCFASAHAEVPASTNILISHDIIDNIEFDVLKEMNIHLVIHLDPIETDNSVVNDLRTAVQIILQSKDPDITMHDFRVVFGESHTNLIFDVDLPFEYETSDDFFCSEITKDIRKIDPCYNTVITVDRNYMNSRNKN
ncbi:MAG: cation transporter [Clostridia bacterium]|nr:cation transporter [Clostridia bacterium]